MKSISGVLRDAASVCSRVGLIIPRKAWEEIDDPALPVVTQSRRNPAKRDGARRGVSNCQGQVRMQKEK